MIQTSNQTKEWAIYDNILLEWEEKFKEVEVPTFSRKPVEIGQIKADFRVILNDLGSTFLQSTEEETEDLMVETIDIGFNWKGNQIVTHQLKLTKRKPKAKLAFVIDDLGYHWSQFETMVTIPRPMTFAVLPELSQSEVQAQRVLEEGYHLILHQPMETMSSMDPGPGAIFTTMSEEEIVDALERNLASLPARIIGVNNHMGSKATADPRVMEIVLKYFKERKMFFIDSSTSPESVIPAVARMVGEDYAKNYIFIDNVNELDAIKNQIRQAAKLALKHGQAITIGHVKTYTAKAILEMIDELESMGIQIVYAKDLLNHMD